MGGRVYERTVATDAGPVRVWVALASGLDGVPPEAVRAFVERAFAEEAAFAAERRTAPTAEVRRVFVPEGQP
jgi:hypothetical protein